jgi:drug/metabolite transporter (DMT)-like permease
MGLFGKALFEYQTDPLTVVALRATLVLITLLVALAPSRRQWLFIQRQDWLFFAAYGLIGVATGFFLFFTALDLVGMAIATILLYTYPVFVTLLSVAFLGERVTASKIIALALTLGGVALVSEIYAPLSSQVDAHGVAVALLCAIAVATHSIFGKKAVQRYSSWTILLYSMGFGALFLMTAQVLFLGLPDLTRPPAFWGLLVALAWVPTLGANLAYVSALAHIEASRASVTATIEPVMATVLAYVFFQETLSLLQILGMALVLVGVLVVRRF